MAEMRIEDAALRTVLPRLLILGGGILVAAGALWTWDAVSPGAPDFGAPGFSISFAVNPGFGQLVVLVAGALTIPIGILAMLDRKPPGLILAGSLNLSALGIVLYHIATRSPGLERFLRDLDFQNANLRNGMGIYSILAGVGFVLLGAVWSLFAGTWGDVEPADGEA